MTVVFRTNFKIIHERCCDKRDKHRDVGDFRQLTKSALFGAVHAHCRREIDIGLWWAVDQVDLSDSGDVRFVIRHAPMELRFEEEHIRSRLAFPYCDPGEVASCVEEEKHLLNYWVEPQVVK